jgi:uncharacterized protein YhaN
MEPQQDQLILTRLALENYGRFTNLQVQLAPSGLTIIYGHNESGKSTLHKAFFDLVFGSKRPEIVDGSKPNTSIKIYGDLAIKEKTFTFIRPAGKAQLCDGENKKIGNAPLLNLFNGIDENIFRNLFCCDHYSIRTGSKELFETDGDLRQALFSTTTGISSLKALQAKLNNELTDVFMIGGRKKKLNIAIQEYEKVLNQYHSTSLTTTRLDDYTRRRRDLEQQLQDNLQLQQEIRQHREQCVKWHVSLHNVQEYIKTESELKEMEETPLFPSTFFFEYRETLQSRTTLRNELKNNNELRFKLRHELTIDVPEQAVLAHSSQIAHLTRRNTQFNECRNSLPLLRQKLRTTETSLSSAAADLRQHLPLTTPTGPIRMVAPDAEQLSTLFSTINNIEQEQSAIEKRIREDNLSHERLGKEMENDVELIGPILAQLKSELETLNALNNERGQITRDQIRTERELKAIISEWNLLPDIPQTVPNQGSIEQLINSLLSEEQKIEGATQEVADQIRQKEATERKIARFRKHHGICTEADLKEAQRHRQELWEKLIDLWSSEGSCSNTYTTAGERFWESVVAVDEILESMRKNAQSVAQLVTLEDKLDDITANLNAASNALAGANGRHVNNLQQWQELCTRFIIPTPAPRAGIKLFQDLHTYQRKRLDLKGIAESLQTIDHQIQSIREKVDEYLTRSGSAIATTSLSAVELYTTVTTEISNLSLKLGQAKADSERRKELETNISRLELELAEKVQHHNKACTELHDYLANFKWPSEIARPTLLSLSKTAREYNDMVTDHLKIIEEIESKQTQVSAFTEELTALATLLIPMADLNYPDQIADQLANLKDTHTAYHTRAEQLRKNLDEAEKKALNLSAQELQLEDTIKALCSTADTEFFEDIESKVAASQARTALSDKFISLKKTLRTTAGTTSIAEFIEATLSYGNEPHSARISDFDHQQHTLDKQRDLINQELHKLDNEWKDLENAGNAVAMAQSIENYRADAAHLIPELLTRLFASRLLKRVADRLAYEEEQPVLRRASHHFTILTSGSFTKIAVDQTDDGTDTLVGVRAPDQVFVHPNVMSDGTRDQLYLSLRLAALERLFEESRPLPVFFDDAFITFDGDRLEAAVRTLMELGKITQVVYFTHDAGMKEIGEQLGVRVIELKRGEDVALQP